MVAIADRVSHTISQMVRSGLDRRKGILMYLAHMLVLLIPFLGLTETASAVVYERKGYLMHFLNGTVGERKWGTTMRVDPYVSYWNANIDLKRREVIQLDPEMGELRLYRELFRQALVPGFIAVEGTYNPLLNIGVNFFEGPENSFRLLTAGHTKPYSLSLFLGNFLPFREIVKEGTAVQTGAALMGYFVGIGDKWVSENTEFFDRWIDLEWKIFGNRPRGETTRLKWRLAAGVIIHQNTRFPDVFTMNVFRRRLDKQFRAFSLIENSSIGYTMQIPISDSPYKAFPKDYFARHTLTVGKSYPITERVMFELKLGVSWERFKVADSTSPSGFRFDEDFEFIVAPNVLF